MAEFITCDVPLLMRLLEECREEIKSDAELHFLTEQLLEEQSVKGKPLTMDDYARIQHYKNKFSLYCEQMKDGMKHAGIEFI